MNLPFSVGMFAFAIAVIFPLIYLASYGLRAIAAWMTRRRLPTDRVWAFALFYMAVGFVLGCLSQPQWDGLGACRSTGKSVAACMFPRL